MLTLFRNWLARYRAREYRELQAWAARIVPPDAAAMVCGRRRG